MRKTSPSARPSDLVSATKFCQIFMKFGLGALYKNLSSRRNFRENNPIVRQTVLRRVNAFLLALSICLDHYGQNSTQSFTPMPLSVCFVKIGAVYAVPRHFSFDLGKIPSVGCLQKCNE